MPIYTWYLTAFPVEVLHIELHNPEKHFEELIRFFFMFHDPTTKNRQGNDSGFQYASFIFCGDHEQNRIAQKVIRELQLFLDSSATNVFLNKRITTRVGPLMAFTEATADHQQYLEKHPNGYWYGVL
jgi:peptide-methionine (S)-S-oxide reductase